MRASPCARFTNAVLRYACCHAWPVANRSVVMTTVEKRRAEAQVSDNARADELLCRALRDEVALWSGRTDATFEANVLARAEYHGVAALLNERASHLIGWSQSSCEALRDRARAHAFWELRHGHAMGEVIEALTVRGIGTLFFKGTALAYSLYDNPVWRTRGDTDLLVAPEYFAEAGEALLRLGYKKDFAVSGEFVTQEQSYTLHLEGGGSHVIDLHRRVNNSQLLGRLFGFEELRAKSVALPRLHAKARALGPTHALLLACLHRLTHANAPYYVDGVRYYDPSRLIWLYDVHLLARSYSDDQWRELAHEARKKGLCFATLDGLVRAQEIFHSPIPEAVMDARRQHREPIARYFQAGPVRQHWIDFQALEGLRERLTFAREIVFPSVTYMRKRYGFANAAWVPLLYARRAAAGVASRLKTRSTGAEPAKSKN